MTREQRKNMDAWEDSLGENPFTKNLVLETKLVDEKGKFIRTDEGNFITSTLLMDKEISSRIYVNPEKRNIVINLSANCMRMFLWIVFKLESGKEYVFINPKAFMDETHTSSINTFKEAVKKLIELEFIKEVPNEKNLYWINIRYFFSGNRINLAKRKYDKQLKKENESKRTA